jgi:hypothetical protein
MGQRSSQNQPLNLSNRIEEFVNTRWIKAHAVLPALILSPILVGCGPLPPNNTLWVETSTARLLHTGQTVLTPLGLQPVAGQLLSDITTGKIQPFGSQTYFAQVTTADTTTSEQFASIDGTWPTEFSVDNVQMPAYWTVEWSHPPYCYDQSAAPYPPLANPYVQTYDFEPSSASALGMFVKLNCYTNTPLNPGFIASNVSPQFVLDDAIPATIQVAAFSPIQSGPSLTNLRVFATDFSNPAIVTATSIGANSMSATFPYPTQSNGLSLPAGAYITSMTTDPASGQQTTNGMEPFYIGHDDTSFTSAFGVAIANPKVVKTIYKYVKSPGGCLEQQPAVEPAGGTPLPLVTLFSQNSLAVGSTSRLLPVGLNPTVVIPFNDQSYTTLVGGGSPCSGEIVTQYTGAQTALVVNTGGNSISIVNIGYSTQYPTGSVSVGNQPVAAAINSSETMAYIANYVDGTVSEVNLSNLTQTRTIPVMLHPSTLTFDSNGNLWVGGQGSVMNIDIGNWSIASTSPVDGTVNGSSYDPQTGVLIQSVLRNGNSASPVEGGTEAAQVNFSTSPGTSYATQTLFNVASGTQTSTSTFSGDNNTYSQSPIASQLAFPAQTAFTPPIYTATAGDVTATVSGTSFVVFVIGTGEILVQGTLPYPARGVAMTSNMLYVTMPDSNSLVSLPMQLP